MKYESGSRTDGYAFEVENDEKGVQQYYALFTDGEGVHQRVWISAEVYSEMLQAQRHEAAQMKKLRRHNDDAPVDEEHLPDTEPSPEEKVLQFLEIEQLNKAKAALTEVQLRRLSLFFYDNMSMTEIAEKEGVSVMSVSVSINDGLKKMRSILRGKM